MAPQLFEANGISIAVEDYGSRDGVPLILVRGQGSQMVHWSKAFIDAFVEEGFRVIIFDNRDVGLSQRCAAPGVSGRADEILTLLRCGEALPAAYGIDDMARDVTGVLDALGVKRAHIFGSSMGGMITQQALLQSPDRFRSATILMSSSRPAQGEESQSREALIKRAEALLVRPCSREDYMDALVADYSRWGGGDEPMTSEELSAIRAIAGTAYDRGVDAEGMNRQVLAIFNAPDRRPGLASVEVPCLVIHGEDDTLVPIEFGKEIADLLPNSEFHAVPGMGHSITRSQMPTIVTLVSDFIHRHSD